MNPFLTGTDGSGSTTRTAWWLIFWLFLVYSAILAVMSLINHNYVTDMHLKLLASFGSAALGGGMLYAGNKIFSPNTQNNVQNVPVSTTSEQQLFPKSAGQTSKF